MRWDWSKYPAFRASYAQCGIAQVIVPQVDDELDSPTWQNPFLEMRLSVAILEPEVVDESAERWGRLVGPVQHEICLKEINRSRDMECPTCSDALLSAQEQHADQSRDQTIYGEWSKRSRLEIPGQKLHGEV